MTELTKEHLKELLSYDPETGIFTNLTQRGKRIKIGGVAGFKGNGYVRIEIDYKTYQAHRLTWLYTYGEFPETFLDHINEIRDDNRLVNLRLATRQENHHNISTPNKNNASGLRGVCWHKFSGKWRAQIMINGRVKYLGNFDTAEQASKAYVTAKRELHPFWEEKTIRGL
jgi:hypothetical protein